MKKIILPFMICFFGLAVIAQQKEGTVSYTRTMQMQVNLQLDNDALQRAIPRTRTDKFELTFGNNKSLWKNIDDDSQEELSGGEGVQVRMVAPGQNDIVFHDLTSGKRIDQREIFDKKFVVTDSVQKLSWKITGQTKEILGYTTQQAVAQRIGTRTMMNMDNGKFERKEIADTTTIVAWFTTAIPVSAGPEVQGQLPGLILALDMNNGRMVYVATEISQKADIASIQAPTKGKKVTPQEFRKERERMMEEMQKNNSGGRGNTIIRMN